MRTAIISSKYLRIYYGELFLLTYIRSISFEINVLLSLDVQYA